MNIIANIIIDIFILIFAFTAILTSLTILFLIFYHRDQFPFNTTTHLICNNYLAIIFSCVFLLDTYIHNMYGIFHGNTTFNNWWCYARTYIIGVTLAALYHSYLLQACFRLFRVVFYKYKRLCSSQLMFRLIVIQWLTDFLLVMIGLILQQYDYMPEYYYCQILYTNWRGILNISIIVYYFPMTAIGLIYFYIIHYVKQHRDIFIRQNRHRANQRDLNVLRRIIVLLGMLCMLSFPSVILYFWYLITGYLYPYIYHFQWITFTLSLAILPMLTAYLTPRLPGLLTLTLRLDRRTHPAMTIQQRQTAIRQEAVQ